MKLSEVLLAPLPGATDWRQPEHRREVFQDFYECHTSLGVHPGLVYALIPYLRKWYGWDDEQALWFAFLNGNSQHPLTSLMLHRRGSRPAEAEGMLEWYLENRAVGLGWDTDRRYHRRALEVSTRGYLALLDGESQASYWQRKAEGGWWSTWGAVTAIPTFGRLSAWSFCDYLHICGIDVNCESMLLADRDGSRSHRNGLCIVSGLDVYDWHQSNPDWSGRYPSSLLRHLEAQAADLLAEANVRARGTSWERDVNYLTLESALCTYKSWHRPNRRYPGVYADMLYDRIKATEERFPDEPMEVFWQARRDCLPDYLRLEDNPTDPGLSSAKQNHYRLTGEIPALGNLFGQYWSAFDEAVKNGDLGVFR